MSSHSMGVHSVSEHGVGVHVVGVLNVKRYRAANVLFMLYRFKDELNR